MAFTLNQLEIFVLVAESGSFSAAARKLKKAQSAVSTAVSNLEIELGLELFSREAKYPTLTLEGRTFLAAAESILRQRRSLEELANTLSLGLESRLDIVADGAVPMRFLENALSALEGQYPQIRLNILRPNQKPGLEYISAGRADLGLIPAAAKYGPDIAFRRLGDVAFANVAPQGHQLAQLRVVNFAQLHSHRQLIYAPHSGMLPTEEYLHSGKSWHFNSYSTLLACLKKGIGWTSCPKHLIETELKSGELVELDLEAYPVTEWLVGLDLIWATTRRAGIAASWLKNYLVESPKPGLANTSRGGR